MHIQRAAILCLLYDKSHSLEDVILAVNQQKKAPIQEAIIQIKTLQGMCDRCNTFLGKNMAMVNRHIEPNHFNSTPRVIRDISKPFIDFVGADNGVLMNVHNDLLIKSGLSRGSCKIRISNSVAEVGF